MSTSKGSIIGVAVVAGLLLVVVSGGPANRDAPLDPRSDAPLGTSALVTLLERLGSEVDLSTGLPRQGDEVGLLLDDRLDEDQTVSLKAWVRAGGRLVVTDPTRPGSTPATLASVVSRQRERLDLPADRKSVG